MSRVTTHIQISLLKLFRATKVLIVMPALQGTEKHVIQMNEIMFKITAHTVCL